MLVLSRKVGEKIIIGGNVTVVVQRVSRNRVALAIEAPADVRILRGELNPFGEESDDGGDGIVAEKTIAEQLAVVAQKIVKKIEQNQEGVDESDSYVHQQDSDLHSGDSVISRGTDETVILKRNAPITAK